MKSSAFISAFALEELRRHFDERFPDLVASGAVRDRIALAYYGKVGTAESTNSLRNRVHWMASKAQGPKVLDVGTSEGILPILLARQGLNVLGVDIDESAIAVANQILDKELEGVRKRIEYRVCDFVQALGEGPFDCIFAGEVIEHLPSPPRLIEECFCALREGGVLVLTTPFGLSCDFDHKITLFLSDIFEWTTPFFEQVELSEEDGYIRFVGVRRKEIVQTSEVDWSHLLRLTEVAMKADQIRKQRLLDDRRAKLHDLHELLDQKRLAAEGHAEALAALEQESLQVRNMAEAKDEALNSLRLVEQSLRDELRAQVKLVEDIKLQNEVDLEQERESSRYAFEQLGLAEASIQNFRNEISDYKNDLSDSETQFRSAISAFASHISDRVGTVMAKGSKTGESARGVLVEWADWQSMLAVNDVGSGRLSESEDLIFQFPVLGNSEYEISFVFDCGFDLPATKDALARVTFCDLNGHKLKPPFAGIAESQKVGSYIYLKATPNGGGSLRLRCPAEARSIQIGLRLWGAGRNKDIRLMSLPKIINETLRSAVEGIAMVEPVQDLELQEALDKLKKFVPNLKKRAANYVEANPLFGAEELQAPKRRRVFSILDEMSDGNFEGLLDLVRLSRENYANQIESEKVDYALIESSWNGNSGDWVNAFTSPNLRHENSKTLLKVMSALKDAKVPIVFWNKEDPMHYSKFLPIAKQANLVLTTDANCLPEYKKELPSGAKCEVLPFGANPKICNPANRFRKKASSVCFAGAYYVFGHDDRRKQMDELLPVLLKHQGVIYDRYFKLGSDRYRFPEIFDGIRREGVPFVQMVNLYKQFQVFLNVNTVVDSPTMMSRRVYELLACGTPVVSTPSKAIDEQFDGIVQVASNEAEADALVQRLLSDHDHWNRISHLGYRKVMTQHSYSLMLPQIARAAGVEADDVDQPLVSIIVASCRPQNINRMIENISRQDYPNLEVICALTPNYSVADRQRLEALTESCPNIKRSKVLIFAHDVSLGRCLNEAVRASQGNYLAKIDDDNFYFAKYVTDQMIPFSFGDYSIVGKNAYHCYLGGLDKLILRSPNYRHRDSQFVAGDAMIMRRDIFAKTAFPETRVGEDTKLIKDVLAFGGKIYSADTYNFIKYRDADPSVHTWKVEEEKLLKDSEQVGNRQDFEKVVL